MENLSPAVAHRIKLTFAVGFALVLIVGGLSVLLSWIITNEVKQGARRGLETEAIERIHVTLHHFLGDVVLVLQGGQTLVPRPPEETLRQLKTDLATYEAHERAQWGDEARQEVIHLGELKSIVARVEGATVRAMEASAQGRPLPLVELAVLNDLAYEGEFGSFRELRALHRKKFDRATEASHRRIFVISALYVGFAFGGSLLLFLGNRFLFRTLVLPITRLAEAALRLSGGDLSHRVAVQSADEVGQLSRAFNLMADRLEAHQAARLNFEAELERQVAERTRELEEVTATLRATQAQLIRSERIAVTGQIAAGVTHEIRSPLNSMAINVHLLRRSLSGESAQPPFHEGLNPLATLEYEISRINRILEEFVNFARLPPPHFERVEIDPLLQELLEFLRPLAAKAGVRIEVSSASAATRVKGDQDQLRQVFLNLGQNALQSMPRGGVLGVTIGQDDGWAVIAVTDCGPGIPEAEHERIFLPFVTTKAEGLGLGLAIVRRIVEDHGGTVGCQNRAEGGAAFVVRLPLAGLRSEG